MVFSFFRYTYFYFRLFDSKRTLIFRLIVNRAANLLPGRTRTKYNSMLKWNFRGIKLKIIYLVPVHVMKFSRKSIQSESNPNKFTYVEKPIFLHQQFEIKYDFFFTFFVFLFLENPYSLRKPIIIHTVGTRKTWHYRHRFYDLNTQR